MFNVGFVGLGHQGAPIAQMIARAGWPLMIYARRPAALEPFRDSGAHVVPSLRALGERSDLVGVCVVDDAQVAEVVRDDNLLAGMRPGSIIAVHSTVHPDTCRRLAAEAAERGVTLIDAPVSGSAAAAYEGRLGVMVGGDEAAFERCLPVFQTYGDRVLRLGPVGSGQLAKLVNNVLFTANLELIEEAIGLGRDLGLDAEALLAMLAGSSGRSFAMDSYRLSSSSGALSHAYTLLRKDAEILAAVLAARGVAAGMIHAAAEAALQTMAPEPPGSER